MRRGFVVHHDQDATPVYTTDSSHNRCDRFWQGVYNWHTEHNGWVDIAYSFGVCRHGIRYVGRGWDKSQFAGGADQKVDDFLYRDSEWCSVLAFLGGPEKPTPEMLRELRSTIEAGRLLQKCGTGVIPHNLFRKKTCPGPELTAFCANFDVAPVLSPQAEDPEVELSDTLQSYVVDGNHPSVENVLAWTHTQANAIKAKVDSLTAGVPVAIDYDLLATKVADKLAQRLAS